MKKWRLFETPKNCDIYSCLMCSGDSANESPLRNNYANNYKLWFLTVYAVLTRFFYYNYTNWQLFAGLIVIKWKNPRINNRKIATLKHRRYLKYTYFLTLIFPDFLLILTFHVSPPHSTIMLLLYLL